MSEERDRAFFRNYTLIIGLLALMIVVFIFLARHFGMNEQAYLDQHSAAVSSLTSPVGKVRIEGQAEEPAAAATQQETAPAAAAPAAANETVDTGKRVYNSLCFSCHGTGLPNIPQLGHKDQWANRIAKGKELLYEHALKGFTGESGVMMPAKGGNPALSDDEVRAAVDYMVTSSS